MSTSLIFSAAPLTGLPVHLVFGDEPTAEVPSIGVYVEGVFNLAAGDIADLTGTIANSGVHSAPWRCFGLPGSGWGCNSGVQSALRPRSGLPSS